MKAILYLIRAMRQKKQAEFDADIARAYISAVTPNY